MLTVMFFSYVLLLVSAVLALPLAPRDVVDPPITSPTTTTVWHVGQTATVTWNTTGLPVNQTNPVGMLVLGYLYNNSENLMLNSPLATGLNYSVGKAQITVPNVPTRSDYIVVLFGDSGNASPEFTIINDASSSAPATTSAASQTSPPGPTPTPTPTSPPPSTPINVQPASTGTSSMTGPTALSSSNPTTTTSSTVVVVTSSTPSPTKSNSAWKNRVPSLGTSLGAALVVVYFAFS